MADGLGLLESAQSAAVGIPYKNIALNQESNNMFLNAFAKAAQVNQQKLQLEQQLKSLQYKIYADQRDAAFQEKKLAYDQDYRNSQLSKAYDKMDLDYTLAKARNDRLVDQFNLTNTLKATREENAAKAGIALAEAVKDQDPGDIGTAARIADVRQKYAAALGTEEGGRVWRQFQETQNAAALAKHRALNDNRRLLKDVLSTQGEQGFRYQELQRPKDTFLKSVDEKGNPTLNVVEYPVSLGGGKIEYRPLSNEEVMKYSTRDKKTGQVIFGPKLAENYPGVTWRQTTEANYDKVLKPMYESSYGQIDPGNLAGQPQPLDRKNDAIEWLKANNLPLTEANIQHYQNASQSQ